MNQKNWISRTEYIGGVIGSLSRMENFLWMHCPSVLGKKKKKKQKKFDRSVSYVQICTYDFSRC